VLRGEGQRAFYRWVEKELKSLFPRLPERTRLFRLLQQHADATGRFLAKPSLFCVCDTYGIELIHPWREGRSPQQIGRKGKSNRRWIVGAKCFVLCNDAGQVVEWECGGANVHDTIFHCALEPFEEQIIVLADNGFKARTGTPHLLKICDKGTWNERMLIETLFSMFTTALHLKKLTERVWSALRARLAYTMAAFNLCTNWSGEVKLEIASFTL
jgi:hypothetical protein